MFRRRWEGLPKDVEFESDLEKLGFFVNDKDEIRSIENPEEFFQFRINRSDRVNERRGLHMNQAVEDIVHERLEEAGLKKLLLPLDGDCKGPGRTPIFISKDLETKSRVVILVNDTEQDLGILAHRIAGGSGGINMGSMVSIVQALQKQSISSKDTSPPGIIITNAAQKLWDPEDKRAVTVRAHAKLRLPSLVHQGRQIDSRNWIPSNEDPFDHMEYILNKVLPQYGKANCRLDFIAIGIGADELEAYMDDTGWSKVGKQINTLTLLGSTTSTDRLNNKEYMKFRTQRSRAWVTSDAPLGTPLANYLGNPKCTMTFADHKVAAVYSAGVPFLIELIFITAKEPILSWIQDVARVPKVASYTHPKVVVTYTEEQEPAVWDEPVPVPTFPPSSGTEGPRKKSKKKKGKNTAKKSFDTYDESYDVEDTYDKSTVSEFISEKDESTADPTQSPTKATTSVDKALLDAVSAIVGKASNSGESATVKDAATPREATAHVTDTVAKTSGIISASGDEKFEATPEECRKLGVQNDSDDNFTKVKRGRPRKATVSSSANRSRQTSSTTPRGTDTGQKSKARAQPAPSAPDPDPASQSKSAPQDPKSGVGKPAAAGKPAEAKKPAIQRDPRVDNHEKGLSVLKRPIGSEDKETVVGTASKRLKENDRGTSASQGTNKANVTPAAAPVDASVEAPATKAPVKAQAAAAPAKAPSTSAPAKPPVADAPVKAPAATAPGKVPAVSVKVEAAPGQDANKISTEAKGKQIAKDITSESGKTAHNIGDNPQDTKAEHKTVVDAGVKKLNFICEESDSENAAPLPKVPVAAPLAAPAAKSPIITAPAVAATELKGSTGTISAATPAASSTSGSLEAAASALDHPTTSAPTISYSRAETPENPLYLHGANASSVPTSETCGASDSGDSDAAVSAVSAPPLLQREAQDVPQTSAGVSVEMAGGPASGGSNRAKNISAGTENPADLGYTYIAPPKEGEEDDFTPEIRADFDAAMHRFDNLGSMIDPRLAEKLDADNQDREDGIVEQADGTYNLA